MQLQVADFQGVTAAVFGKTTTEICDGVDEFICNIQ